MKQVNRISIIIYCILVIGMLFYIYGGDNLVKYKLINKIEVPKEFYICFNELDKIADENIKSEFIQTDEEHLSSKYHFGLGLYIRNNWISHDELNLNLKDVFDKLGIHNPDDMSGILITSYHRYLSTKDILLSQQIELIEHPYSFIDKNSTVSGMIIILIIQLFIYILLYYLRNRFHFLVYSILSTVTGGISLLCVVVNIVDNEKMEFVGYFTVINMVVLVICCFYTLFCLIKNFISKHRSNTT